VPSALPNLLTVASVGVAGGTLALGDRDDRKVKAGFLCRRPRSGSIKRGREPRRPVLSKDEGRIKFAVEEDRVRSREEAEAGGWLWIVVRRATTAGGRLLAWYETLLFLDDLLDLEDLSINEDVLDKDRLMRLSDRFRAVPRDGLSSSCCQSASVMGGWGERGREVGGEFLETHSGSGGVSVS
jgi:hypothetical protein